MPQQLPKLRVGTQGAQVRVVLGDLLPGVRCDGVDTYEAKLAALT